MGTSWHCSRRLFYPGNWAVKWEGRSGVSAASAGSARAFFFMIAKPLVIAFHLVLTFCFTALTFGCEGNGNINDQGRSNSVASTGGADADGYLIIQEVSASSAITVLDPRTGERSPDHWSVDSSLAASPDGSRIAFVNDGQLNIMRVGALTLEMESRFELPGSTRGMLVGFNSTGDRVFGAGTDLLLWSDLSGDRMVFCVPFTDKPAPIRLSPDGRHFLWGCRDDSELGTGRTGLYDDFELVFEGPRYFFSASLPDRARFSPDGQWLLVRKQYGGGLSEYGNQFISLLHVPTRTFLLNAFTVDTAAGDQQWFWGPLHIHPTGRVAALASGGRGRSLNNDTEFDPKDLRFVSLEKSFVAHAPVVDFTVGFGPRDIIPPLSADPGAFTRWDHLGFSADGAYTFMQVANLKSYTSTVTTDPTTGITTGEVLSEVVGVTIRRASIDDTEGTRTHDFVGQEQCGNAGFSTVPGYPRLVGAGINLGRPQYESVAPMLVPMAGNAIACRTESAWNVIDGDVYTLEDFGDIWSPDRRWADMGLSEDVGEVCYRRIERREVEVVCPKGQRGSLTVGSVARLWLSGGFARPNLPATVTNISRIAATPGDEVHVFGLRFGDSGTLSIGASPVDAGHIVSWGTNHIVFTMPEDAPESGRVLVTTANGSDTGAVAIHLTRTTRWEPPFAAAQAASSTGPGLLSVSLDAPLAEADDLRLSTFIGDTLERGTDLLFPTENGVELLVPWAPTKNLRWLYVRRGDMVRPTRIDVSSEYVVPNDRWAVFGQSNPSQTLVRPDSGFEISRMSGRTVATVGTAAILLSDAFEQFELPMERATTCTVCLNRNTRQYATDGLGRTAVFSYLGYQLLDGWGGGAFSTQPQWGPAVSPDLGGQLLEAVGLAPDAVVVVGSAGGEREAWSVSDTGATPLAALGSEQVSALLYSDDGTTRGWFVSRLQTLAFLQIDGALFELPAPGPGISIDGGKVLGAHFYLFEHTTGRLYHIDRTAASPTWTTLEPASPSERMLDVVVDSELGRLFAIRADGVVLSTAAGPELLSPLPDMPLSYPGRTGDYTAALLAPLGGGKLAVEVPPPNVGWSLPLWFLRALP